MEVTTTIRDVAIVEMPHKLKSSNFDAYMMQITVGKVASARPLPREDGSSRWPASKRFEWRKGVFVHSSGIVPIWMLLWELGVIPIYATVLHLLGIDHNKLTVRHNGIDRRLTDGHGHVITDILV